jgi:hypothetical protein
VQEKLGSGFWTSAATALARSVVTESKVAAKVAAELATKIPAALAALGISAEVQPKFLFGSFAVLKCRITEVTPLQLIRFAKGEKFAAAFASMLDAFQELELHDAIGQAKAKLETRVQVALVEKLAAALPGKLLEQGITATVDARTDAMQAEFFFDFIERLQRED